MKNIMKNLLRFLVLIIFVGFLPSSFVPVKAINKQVVKLVGSDRYATAVELSKKQFSTADAICIVNGQALADGLTITPLATHYKAPILLSNKDKLPQSTKDEILRLKATRAFIGGREGVISENVVNELKSLGIKEVIRLGGKDRYDTALEIAKYIDANCFTVKEVVVANGYGEADSLSIASVAGSRQMAIILTEKDNMNSNVHNWVKSKKLSNAYIIGSKGVVSDELLVSIDAMVEGDVLSNRLGGKDRYETNAKVIQRFFPDELNEVYLSKGWNGYLIDALSSGVISALNDSPVILLDNNSAVNRLQQNVLAPRTSNIVYEVGGGLNKDSVNKVTELLSSKITLELPSKNETLSLNEIESYLPQLGYTLDSENSAYGIRLYFSSASNNAIVASDNGIGIALGGEKDGAELSKKDRDDVNIILNWIFKTNGNSIYDKVVKGFKNENIIIEGKYVQLLNAEVPTVSIVYY